MIPLIGFEEEETYYTTETANCNVAQVAEKYNEAVSKKDYEAAKNGKTLPSKLSTRIKEAGIDSGNVDAISNYVGNPGQCSLNM